MFAHLRAFHEFPFYQCYDPPPPQATSVLDLEWDDAPLSEADSRYETPMTLCTGQGNSPEIEDSSKLNSFRMKVELDRKPQENVGMSVEYLLSTKQHLEEELQDLSSNTNVESDEKNFKLPPTIGELQMKYLQEFASMR